MVLLINLDPTMGSETGKSRPCIVVTNNIYNSKLPVIQVVPITAWSEKKSKIISNVILEPTSENGLSKDSIADCLQTRPVDYKERLISVLGKVTDDDLKKIDSAIKIVFGISTE